MSFDFVTLETVATKIDYGLTASAASQDTGFKFLRITDIQTNHVDWKKVPFCEVDESGFTEYKLEPGDIVFARTGATTGKSYLITNVPSRAVFASYLIRVRPNREFLDPRFLAYYF